MVNQKKKIGDYTEKTTLTGSEQLLIDDNGTTRRASVLNTIKALIKDTVTATTSVWSSSKVNTLLAGKSDTGHTHATSDITSGTLGIVRGGTGLATTPTNGQVLIGNGSGFTLANLTGSGLATVTNGAGSITIGVAAQSVPSTKKRLSGLPVRYSSASAVIIPAGLIARSSDDTADMEATTDLTVSLASSGANGLDAGAEASNTWYYLYLIKNPGSGAVAGLLSTVNEAVTGTVTLPSGYTLKRQLPIAVRNDGSSNVVPFFVGAGWPTCPEVFYATTMCAPAGAVTTGTTLVLDGGTSAAYADINLSSFVPPISKLAILRPYNATITNGVNNYIRTPGASIDQWVQYVDNGRYMAETLFLATSGSQRVEYKTTGALDVSVLGYVVTEL